MENKIRLDFQKLLAPAALIAIYIFFCFAGNNFFSSVALVNILDSSYYIAFLAIGVTFSIITGGIDLSIGAVMMCAAMVGGVAYANWGFSIWAALLVCVLTGSVFGLINGILIAKFKLVPFVATLGVQMVASGFGAIISNVVTMRYPTVGSEDGVFKAVFFKAGRYPVGILWLAAFFLLAYVLLNKTRFGRYTFAMGSNEEATRLSGVDVDKWKIIVYVVVGAFTGMAGVLYAAAYTSIVPSTGAGMEILGIAAVVIGGTSLAGGVGSLSGTLSGVYIMAVLRQGLMSMGLQGHYQTFFTGIVLLAAVMLDVYRNQRASHVKKKA
jgi:ribose transport system permease protein